MMRRALATALACGVLLASCADLQREGTPTEPRQPGGPIALTHSVGECTTLDALKQMAADLFGAGSPDYNSVRGKLDNLDHQIQIGNLEEAKTRALDIVSFTKTKWDEGGLPGTKEQLDLFIYSVMCYAGFDLGEFGDGTSVIIVEASSTETQEGYNNDNQAGFLAPPGTLNAPDGTPVVVTVSPFQGVLNTQLDTYEGAFDFNISVDLNGDIVIGVCLTEALPPGIQLNELLLGHNLPNGGFELTPKAAPPPGLACPDIGASRSGLPRWLAALGRLLMPRPLQAAVLAGGGVGGSAAKLSPFAPTDPTLSATGGTGGSAGKLSPPALSRVMADNDRAFDLQCDFPTGAEVSEECRPQITIQTRQGTPLVTDVRFEIGSGGGKLSQEAAGACGAFAASVVTFPTDATGFARACWQLGNQLGQQKVWVSPQQGGLPAGIEFWAGELDQNGDPITYQPGEVVLTFFANAVPEGLTTFMCELGTADLNFNTFTTNNTGKFDLGPIRVKEPVNKNTIDVAFFMSVTGQSSALETYPVQLLVYRSTSATTPGSNLVGSAMGNGVTVTLPGDNGSPAFQEIRLNSPVLADPGTTNYLWLQLSILNPPSQRKFQLWYTTKLGSTTSPACTDAAVFSPDLRKSKLGPAIRLKN